MRYLAIYLISALLEPVFAQSPVTVQIDQEDAAASPVATELACSLTGTAISLQAVADGSIDICISAGLAAQLAAIGCDTVDTGTCESGVASALSDVGAGIQAREAASGLLLAAGDVATALQAAAAAVNAAVFAWLVDFLKERWEEESTFMQGNGKANFSSSWLFLLQMER